METLKILPHDLSKESIQDLQIVLRLFDCFTGCGEPLYHGYTKQEVEDAITVKETPKSLIDSACGLLDYYEEVFVQSRLWTYRELNIGMRHIKYAIAQARQQMA